MVKKAKRKYRLLSLKQMKIRKMERQIIEIELYFFQLEIEDRQPRERKKR